MPEPYIAGTRPQSVELKAGETVWSCACGRSTRHPVCDGPHRGIAFTPLACTAERGDR